MGRSGKRVFRLKADGSSDKFSFDEQGTDPVIGVSAFGDDLPIVVTQSKKIYNHQAQAGCPQVSAITWSGWLGRDDLNGAPAGSAESPIEQCPTGLTASGFQVYSRTCSAANLRAAPLICDDAAGGQRQLIDNGWGYRGGCSVCLVYTTECPDGWHAVGVNVHDGGGGRGGEPKPICQQACNGPTQTVGGCSTSPVNQTFSCPAGQRIVAFQQRGASSGDRGSYEFRVGCQ